MFTPFAALAQNAATLIADEIFVTAERELIAQGNVEVLFGPTRLQASRVTYQQSGNLLQIEGPITLNEGDDLLLIADAAELDSDLQNGILRGARVVMNEQLQLAAVELNRVNGRYTQLFKVAATSCHICEDGRPPLWQIRAREVIHDQEERQIYFRGAQLRVLDAPIFYFPRLRLPDPTLERATGFLFPRIRSTSQLGIGLKVPYFITLGDHADLTFTPYFSSSTRTLEARYRHAFRSGDISFRGAVTDDDLLPNQNRAYLFGEGAFDLARDYKLTFDIELTSDNDYLLDYGYSSKDRLDSAVELEKTNRDKYFSTSVTVLRSLRSGEDNDLIPTVVSGLTFERRFFPSSIGGELNVILQAHSHTRTSGLDILGRDVRRLSFESNWHRDWTFGNGMIAGFETALHVDQFRTSQDSTFRNQVLQVTPYVAADLKWPLIRRDARGVSHLLEPVAQVVWSDRTGEPHANEDSTRAELDEGNLYRLNRFPGADAYERGLRATLGLQYTRYDPAGWSLGLTAARSFRKEDLGQFTESSGLDGRRSDWLVAAQFQMGDDLLISNRSLLDDDFSWTKSETRIDWRNDRFDLGTAYLWTVGDLAEDRPDATSEWTFEGAYKLDRHWTAKADWRYDLIEDRAARAGIGFEYKNECVTIEFSASRRFTSTNSLEPTTDFGLTVSLSGFSTGGSAAATVRSCSQN